MTTLYKVVAQDGSALHLPSDAPPFRWSLPTDNGDGTWTPGDWHAVAPPVVACEHGLHLTTNPWNEWITWDAAVHEAEGDGERVPHGADKIACERARLLRPATLPDWWVKAQRFVREEIPAIPWFRPDGDPDPAWKLFVAPTWVQARARAGDQARARAGDQAWTQAWTQAWDQAWTQAWTQARARAGDQARARAWTQARARAWDQAWAQAWARAGDRAWDRAGTRAGDSAELYLMVECICADLSIDEVHRQTAREQWRVWQKGYGLVSEVDGVLYVCAGEDVR